MIGSSVFEGVRGWDMQAVVSLRSMREYLSCNIEKGEPDAMYAQMLIEQNLCAPLMLKASMLLRLYENNQVLYGREDHDKR